MAGLQRIHQLFALVADFNHKILPMTVITDEFTIIYREFKRIADQPSTDQ